MHFEHRTLTDSSRVCNTFLVHMNTRLAHVCDLTCIFVRKVLRAQLLVVTVVVVAIVINITMVCSICSISFVASLAGTKHGKPINVGRP